MTPRIRKLFTFPIDDDLKDGLREIKARDGTPEAEQIRRALRAWLIEKGVRLEGSGERAKPARQAKRARRG